MASKSLWAELNRIEVVRSPRTILMEQASYLTQATKGTLVGRVEGPNSGGVFYYSLSVEMPALNRYTVGILEIHHGLDLYPVRLTSRWTNADVDCVNETEFEAAVASVLSSDAVKALLSRLLSQVA